MIKELQGSPEGIRRRAPQTCRSIEDTGEINLEDLVQVEDVAVTVTHGGYLKRTAVDTYRAAKLMRRQGSCIGMGTRNEDFVEYFLVASHPRVGTC